MSNCIRCEVTRAKAIGRVMKLAGKTAEEIAAFLTKYNEGSYTVYEYLNGRVAVERANKVPPHVPYSIVEF